MAATAASKSETAAKYERLREEVAAIIERIPSVVEAENAEGVQTLAEEADVLIAQLPAKERTALRKLVKDASTAQEKPAEKPSADVVKKDKEAGAVVGTSVDATVKAGSARVFEIAKAKFKGGKEISQIILVGIRSNIIKPDGLPDLKGDLDISKKKAGEVYSTITDALPEEGVDEDADGVRAELNSIQRSSQNYMGDTLVEYIRALDNSPEEAAKYAKLTEGKPDVKLIDAVAAHYDVKLITRSEIAKAKTARKNELAAKVAAGEMSQEEADEALSDDKPAKTPDAELFDSVSKMAKLAKLAKTEGIADLDAKARTATRKKLEAIRDAVKELLGEI